MQKVLITNDDGHKSAGIRALVKEFSQGYRVLSVAPAHEQSWVSKSMTRNRELSIKRANYFEFDGFIVDGTPADCAQLGLYNLVENLPDFIISGINVGSNVGYEQILSSGTIGAALEAALQHVPAFAVSTYYNTKTQQPIDFDKQDAVKHFITSAKIAREIIDKIVQVGFPQNVHVVSINIPWGVAIDCPVSVTKPHQSKHGKLFLMQNGRAKHRGGDSNLLEKVADDSDMAALENNHISVTPITVELTSAENQQILSRVLDAPILKKLPQ